MNINSYSYHVARAYMIRLEPENFEWPASLAALASEAHVTSHQFQQRYRSVVKEQRGNQ